MIWTEPRWTFSTFQLFVSLTLRICLFDEYAPASLCAFLRNVFRKPSHITTQDIDSDCRKHEGCTDPKTPLTMHASPVGSRIGLATITAISFQIMFTSCHRFTPVFLVCVALFQFCRHFTQSIQSHSSVFCAVYRGLLRVDFSKIRLRVYPSWQWALTA